MTGYRGTGLIMGVMRTSEVAGRAGVNAQPSGREAGSAVRLQVLHVPGCPHVVVLTARLAQLTGDRVQVEARTVRNEDEAVLLGMRGSPTLLIDGTDPFTAGVQPPSLSCRLYPGEDGALTGVPSLAQLRQAIASAEVNHA